MDAASTGEFIGYIIGSVIGILIIGALIAFVGKFIFPKSSNNKRFLWGIIIAIGISALSFCSRVLSHIQANG